MNILIICSKRFYNRIAKIKELLEVNGHHPFMPNCYDDPGTEDRIKSIGEEEHQKFKARMFKQSEETISNMDAVLVLNFDKNDKKNYIGGATFLEMYDAFRLGKKIFLYNPVPEGILYDEIVGFAPVIINGDLELINKSQENALKGVK